MGQNQPRCQRCGKVMPTGSRRAACSDTCRRALSRQRGKAKAAAAPLAGPTPAAPQAPDAQETPAPSGGTLATTLELLNKHDRTQTPDGQAAVLLAKRLDAATVLEPGSGLAALQKSHANAMDRALAGVDMADDADDPVNVARTAAEFVVLVASCGVPMDLAEAYAKGRTHAKAVVL